MNKMIIKIDKAFYRWKNEMMKKPNGRNIDLIKEWTIECINSKYSSFSEVIFYKCWTEFAIKFHQYEQNPNTIFRGQSNKGPGWEFEFNQIKSTLNRNEPSIHLDDYFRFIIDGKKYLRKYDSIRNNVINENVSLLELLSFLQHKGIPTPLVDFTYDPITALYFASNIPFERTIGTDSRYISIFEIDCKILLKEYEIKELTFIDNVNYSFPYSDLSNFNPLNDIELDYKKPFIALCKNEFEDQSLKNSNFEKQSGVFIFLYISNECNQNQEDGKIESMEDLLLCIKTRRSISQNAIKSHLIPYESLLLGPPEISSMTDVLFLYLKSKGKTGEQLFDDINAFKYDFMFKTHGFYNINDLDKLSIDSSEKRFLKINGLI